MSYISPYLPYIQIVLSIILILAVVLQRSESSVGGAFGGDSFSSGHHSRRGFERILFIATIVIACLFAILSFIVTFYAE